MIQLVKGVSAKRDASGRVTEIQVEDIGGMGWTMTPTDYLARGHEPPMDELPSARELARQRNARADSLTPDGARALVGKRLRVCINGEEHEGELIGEDLNVIAASSTGQPSHPWMLKTSDDIFRFSIDHRDLRIDVLDPPA
jgi:hypothetical protein